jgi:hypothetical protein
MPLRKVRENAHLPRENDPLNWVFVKGKRKGQPAIILGGDENDPCWLWQGAKKGGYGVTTIRASDYPTLAIGRKGVYCGRKAIMPHQLFYFLKFGNPPRNTELGHTCSRRSCCNPDHVRPITKRENAAEMYLMPDLSVEEWDKVVELLLEDWPEKKIADKVCVSVWSIRKIAQSLTPIDQVELSLDEVPF